MAGLAQICHSAEISHFSVTEVWTLLPSLGLNSAAAAGAATEAEGQPDIPEPLQLILGGTSSSHQRTSASTFPGTLIHQGAMLISTENTSTKASPGAADGYN